MRGPSLALLVSLAVLAAGPAALCAPILPGRPVASAPVASPSPSSSQAFDPQLLLPSFDYLATFLSPRPDGVLQAEETGRIHVQLRNLEDRPMTGIEVSYKALDPVPGLPPGGEVTAPNMAARATASVDIFLPSDRRLATRTAEYMLEIHAAGGYYGSPARLAFQTLAFVPPKLQLVGVDIFGQGALGKEAAPLGRIPLGRRVTLVAQVENLGAGMARNVRARFRAATSSVLLSSTDPISLGEIRRGQTRQVSVRVEVTGRYQGPPQLPVWIDVLERHPDLGFRELLPMPLAMRASASLADPGPAPVGASSSVAPAPLRLLAMGSPKASGSLPISRSGAAVAGTGSALVPTTSRVAGPLRRSEARPEIR